MNPTTTSSQQLQQNLADLKLEQMALNVNEVVDFSVRNQVTLIDALLKLTEHEIHTREYNRIQATVKAGAFPT